ncbi:uncharacterized protein Dana_GF26874 [Drosophila ananassae]|uniref:Uncharacterized protein n=1 Tax=Drosophila ananassae TaxID=7217 RepID=A0A0P8Y0Y5_DROAN|nr:uncharacterized protein Dana_GF26874 [Drosophila ananassae]
MKSMYIIVGETNNNAQPFLKVLKGADDPKSPLIMLANPTSNVNMEVMSEPELLNPDFETTLATPTDSTSKTENPHKKSRPQQIKKPSLNQQQKSKLHELLSMPGGWESFPLINPVPLAAMTAQAHIQPIFYPMPIYVPYPIPLMLNQMNTVSTSHNNNLEDQINLRFNELMSAKLLRDAFKGDSSKWQEINNNFIKPGNQKWRGKFRRTTSTSTTTTTESPVTKPTEPTRNLDDNSKQSDSAPQN